MSKDPPYRGPGRPKKAEQKGRITITLSLATIQYLDNLKVNRSEFIGQCIAEHREHVTHQEK